MPKITTLVRTIAGQVLGLELWYNAKRLFFIEKGLPNDFTATVGYEYTLDQIPTQAAIEQRLDKAIKVYEDLLKSSDEVLIVDASLGYRTMQAMGVDLSMRSDYPLRGGQSGDSHGFSFTYQKLIRVRVGDATTFIEERPNKSPFRKEGEPDTIKTRVSINTERSYVIEYTPERQAVLDQFIAATAALGHKMTEFFGREPQQLIASIDNGAKLLGQ